MSTYLSVTQDLNSILGFNLHEHSTARTQEHNSSGNCYRYQPTVDQRVFDLPLYTIDEIKLLEELLSKKLGRRNGSDYSRHTNSFSSAIHTDNPLRDANSFYMFLDDYNPQLVDLLLMDRSKMPLYINSKDVWIGSIASWRLMIKK